MENNVNLRQSNKLILYIPIRLKNKKETYSHTAAKLLLRSAINLEKGRYFFLWNFKF